MTPRITKKLEISEKRLRRLIREELNLNASLSKLVLSVAKAANDAARAYRDRGDEKTASYFESIVKQSFQIRDEKK